MRWLVGLTLISWMLTASAQFGLGLLFQGIQGIRGAQSLAGGDFAEIKRQSEEMRDMYPQIQRLKRYGRYEEAEALNERYFELMSSGAFGRLMNSEMARSSGMQQALQPGMPQGGTSIENMKQLARLSFDALRMERLRMEADGAVKGEPLFVRPAMIVALEPDAILAKTPKALPLIVEGTARMQAKDYTGAEQSLEKALSLARSPTIIQLMVQLDIERGRGDAALRRLQSAIDEFGAQDARSGMIAPMLWRQAQVYGAMASHDRAADACERALAIVAPMGSDSAENAAGQNNLGVALQLGGNTARALEYYERSISALQSAIRNSSQDSSAKYRMFLPRVAANRGLALWQLGNVALAAESFRIAVQERDLFEFERDAPLTERTRLAKAQFAAVELDALLTLEQTSDGKGLGLQTLLERKGALLEQRTRAEVAFRRDVQAQREEPPPVRQDNTPGIFGRLFASPVTREQAMRQRPENDPGRQLVEDKDLLREYDAVVNERASTLRTPSNAAHLANLDTRIQVMQLNMRKRGKQPWNDYISEEEINEMRRKYRYDVEKFSEAFQEEMRKRRSGRAETAREERISLVSRVQGGLPRDAALLEMVRYRPLDPRPGLTEDKRWGPARYGTYVIRPGGEPQYVDLGEAGALEKLIAEFRVGLSDPTSNSARDLGRKLDEAVMRPIRRQLGNALTLYIAPEGALNLVPVGALVDEDGAYLLERYTINYLASGRDLLYLGRNNASRSPPIAFADPAFDEQGSNPPQPAGGPISRSRDFRSTKFGRLPGTAEEAQALTRILPDLTVLSGAAATETAAKKVAGPRVLHFATHGFFLEDLPGESEDPMLRSGLVFAGVNALKSANDDGVLTALEASTLDLRGTKLVVLSACDTGLGEVKSGEGVFGLRRAFVVAGAESLLMSLWQVSDEATKGLMTSYYTLLSRGEARTEALRKTQISMLKTPVTAHPYYWAAFISSGETGSLQLH